MVPGVDNSVGPPDSLQRAQFAGKSCGALPISIETTRNRFMMNQCRPRLVKCLPAPAVQPHAQVHIIEGDCEVVFIQPANCQEGRSRCIIRFSSS